MRFQILGCGGSIGVPSVGCRCAVCLSANPKNKRTRTSGLITLDDGRTILIDASPDLRAQSLAADLRRVDAVLFTHSHADHILGIDDLRGFNFVQRSRIPCFGDALTLQEIRRFFHYIFRPDPEYQGGGIAKLDLHEISPYSSFEVCGVPVQHFELKHGRTTISGFKIGSLAYATDCSSIPDRSQEMISGVKTLILGALRFEPHPTHFTIPQAVEAARSLKAEKTYFVHTTHEVEYEEVSAKLPNGIELAFDGLSVAI